MKSVENKLADLRPLIGRTLTKVFHTDRGKPTESFPGLDFVYYFLVVIELDSKDKFQLADNDIRFWDDNETIYEVTHKNWDVPVSLTFNNRKIKDIGFNEYDQIFVRLDNDLLLEYRVDHGCSLDIEKFSNVYSADGKRL
jgi:hypothetical protein